MLKSNRSQILDEHDPNDWSDKKPDLLSNLLVEEAEGREWVGD